MPNTTFIGNEKIRAKDIFGLDKYTEYEFQVLAFTSVGDGPKSSPEVVRTKEDGKESELRKTGFCYHFPRKDLPIVIIQVLWRYFYLPT